MSLIDRTPGGFIALAAYVVYGVVAVEIWMWTAESAAAVAITLALILAVAASIAWYAVRLMDDGTEAPSVPTVAEVAEQEESPLPAPISAPRPRPVVRPVA